MPQTFDPVAGSDQLSASRTVITGRDDTLRSNFSGTGHPSSPVEGQWSFRTDQDKLYICTNPTGPVWVQVPIGVPVAVADGGTGATSASAARTNLGLGALAVLATVGATQIDDNAVTTNKINALAVTAAKIANSTITVTQLANDAVETAKIKDANVTAAKLASGAAASNLGFTPAKVAGPETHTGVHTFDAATWIRQYTTAGTTGPVDYFSHAKSVAGANNDVPYTRIVQGKSSTSQLRDIFVENFIVADATNGSEDSERWTYFYIGGVQTLEKKEGGGVALGAAAGGKMGVGTHNATKYFKNGGELDVWTESWITTSGTATQQVPYDDSIPQNSEGNELTTITVTTVQAADKVLVEVEVNAQTESGTGEDGGFVVALFRDSVANALDAVFIDTFDNETGTYLAKFSFIDAPGGSPGAKVYKVRVGPCTSGATVRWNGIGGARKLGGVTRSGLRGRLLPA